MTDGQRQSLDWCLVARVRLMGMRGTSACFASDTDPGFWLDVEPHEARDLMTMVGSTFDVGAVVRRSTGGVIVGGKVTACMRVAHDEAFPAFPPWAKPL